MHLHPFLAGLGLLAASTNALLIPPSVPGSDEIVTTLPVSEADTVNAIIAEESKVWTVDLECPGCAVDGRPQPANIPSRLRLDFSVESVDGVDRLTVNNYELYPNPDPIHNIFTAPVLPEMGNRRTGATASLRGGRNRPHKNQPLGFAMGSQTVATDDDDDLQLIVIDLQIFSVGALFVESVPRAQVKLVKTASGELGIGSVETITSSSEEPAEESKECTTSVCRWKAIFSEKLTSLLSGMGCRGRRPGMRQGHAHASEMHNGHGPHSHHMTHRHRISRVFMAIATHILLPVLLGLVAGISIGIIITTFIAFAVMLWETFFRRSGRSSFFSRGVRSAEIRQEEDATEVEKAGLLEGQEGEVPPPYEADKSENAV